MDNLKDIFLYLNCLIYEKYLDPTDIKEVRQEIMRKFKVSDEDANKIAQLYLIVANKILSVSCGIILLRISLLSIFALSLRNLS